MKKIKDFFSGLIYLIAVVGIFIFGVLVIGFDYLYEKSKHFLKKVTKRFGK